MIRTSSIKSSSTVSALLTPIPPLFWVLYWSRGTLFTYPLLERVTTTSSSGIRASISMSSSPSIISVFLLSPYLAFISEVSSFIMLRTMDSSERTFSRYIILSSSSLCSLRRDSTSRLVNFCSFISRIAAACFSVNECTLASASFASAGLFADFIIWMIGSMLDSAFFRPSRI